MFYICKKKESLSDIRFGVMDTADGVVEYYQPKELIAFVRDLGLTINGLTLNSETGKWQFKVLQPATFIESDSTSYSDNASTNELSSGSQVAKSNSCNFDVDAYLKENVPYKCCEYIYLESKNVVYAICDTGITESSLFYINVAEDTLECIYRDCRSYNSRLFRNRDAAAFVTITNNRDTYAFRLYSIDGKTLHPCDVYDRKHYMSLAGIHCISERFCYCVLRDDAVDKIVILDLERNKVHPVHTKHCIDYKRSIYSTLKQRYEYGYERNGGKVLDVMETQGKIVVDFELYWKYRDEDVYDTTGHARAKIFHDERPTILYHVNKDGKVEEMFA